MRRQSELSTQGLGNLKRKPEKSTTVKHHIDLKSAFRLSFQHPHQVGLKKRKHKGQEKDQVIKEDVIEPALLERASSVVLALSKDGKLRFCVYYRKLNAMTVHNTYPLSRTSE